MIHQSSEPYRTITLVAGASLPQEVLTLYRDDDIQTKHAIRGFWQALHVNSRCWLLAEPLDHTGEQVKCRFSSSKHLLLEPQHSFVFLLSQEQFLLILEAPAIPIEWEVQTDKAGNQTPVNVSGLRPLHVQQTTVQEQDGSPAAIAPTFPTSLAEYKERVSEDPIAHCCEKISHSIISEASEEVASLENAPSNNVPRKIFPLILVRAMSKTMQQQLLDERDPRQRKQILQHIDDLELMIQQQYLWYWERDNYVVVLYTDSIEGTCRVSIGIHPHLRTAHRTSHRHSA